MLKLIPKPGTFGPGRTITVVVVVFPSLKISTYHDCCPGRGCRTDLGRIEGTVKWKGLAGILVEGFSEMGFCRRLSKWKP